MSDPKDAMAMNDAEYAAARAEVTRRRPKPVPQLPDARTMSEAEYAAELARLGHHRQGIRG